LQRGVSGFIEIKAGSHKTPARRPQARRKSVPEENGKRREEEFCRNLGKKTKREENNKFKPADLTHFQTAADSAPRKLDRWFRWWVRRNNNTIQRNI
jgi:hypothetical protein